MRQQLNILSAQQFEAFVLDCYRKVYGQFFTPTMDRMTKTTLLLTLEEPDSVAAKLGHWMSHGDQESEAVALKAYQSRSPREVPQEAILRGRLEDLYAQRALLCEQGGEIEALTEAIRELRRKLRDGPQLQPGDMLSEGKYQLLRRLGQGGFAVVWEAYERHENIFVAIKVLHGQFARDSTHVERFYRGAKRMESLQHPHMVCILEAAQEDDGYHFFVMARLAGGDLEQAILQQRINREAAVISVLQAGEALEYAHKKGLVHRDIKPSNILLDNDGQAHLTDFDLVWDAESTGGTRTGALGTFLYAAPESMADAKRVDSRADVYSLAMTLAFVLHGRRLPQQAVKRTDLFIAQLSCPLLLKKVLKRALADEPKDRFKDVSALCDAIRMATKTNSTNRHKLNNAAIIGAVIAIVTLIIVLIGHRQYTKRQGSMHNPEQRPSTAPDTSTADKPKETQVLVLPTTAQTHLLDNATAAAPNAPPALQKEQKQESSAIDSQNSGHLGGDLKTNAKARIAYSKRNFVGAISAIRLSKDPRAAITIDTIRQIEKRIELASMTENTHGKLAVQDYEQVREADKRLGGYLSSFLTGKIEILVNPNRLSLQGVALSCYRKQDFPCAINILEKSASSSASATISIIRSISEYLASASKEERTRIHEALEDYKAAQQLDRRLGEPLKIFLSDKVDKLSAMAQIMPDPRDGEANRMLTLAKGLVSKNPAMARTYCRKVMQMFNNRPRNAKVQEAYRLLNSIKGGKDDDDDF